MLFIQNFSHSNIPNCNSKIHKHALLFWTYLKLYNTNYHGLRRIQKIIQLSTTFLFYIFLNSRSKTI